MIEERGGQIGVEHAHVVLDDIGPPRTSVCIGERSRRKNNDRERRDDPPRTLARSMQVHNPKLRDDYYCAEAKAKLRSEPRAFGVEQVSKACLRRPRFRYKWTRNARVVALAESSERRLNAAIASLPHRSVPRRSGVAFHQPVEGVGRTGSR